mgnify:CR=1 FL=1
MRIKKEAFENCDGLRKLKIPTTLAEIDEPMSSCGLGLREIHYPSLDAWLKHDKEKWQRQIQGKVLVIDGETLHDLILPEGVKNIPKWAFKWIGGIKRVTIPESVTEIGEGAFSCCRDLEEVDFRGKSIQLNTWAFSNCTALRKIRFPKHLESISSYSFSGCKALTEIELPDGMRRIERGGFS